ncbi:MAG: hypothetical protein ACUVS6_13725 [Anaerolineae bacterium]
MDMAIEVKGIEQLTAKLGRLAAFNLLRPAMHDSLNTLWGDLAQYPRPPERGAFTGFKSDKQRRWFFAALRQGLIQVPYVRTGTLGRSWTQRIDLTADGMVGRVGTNIAYAPFVQDRERQAEIHRGRWQTVQDVLHKRTVWIVRRFQRQINAALRR